MSGIDGHLSLLYVDRFCQNKGFVDVPCEWPQMQVTVIASFEKVGTSELRRVKNHVWYTVRTSLECSLDDNATLLPGILMQTRHSETAYEHTSRKVCECVNHSSDRVVSLRPATIMRGKKISTDLKYTIVALGDFHTVSEIEALTAVSRWQIYHIRRNWETTGCVEPERVRKRTGRPHFLTTNEEAVSFSSIFQGEIAETKE